MTSFSDHVPLPPLQSVNQGLTPCLEQTMLTKFGKPGALSRDCSDPTGDFVRRVRNRVNVGPFKATGLDYAVESLLQVFAKVKADNSQLFEQVKSDGMLCVRARHHNPAVYSNHSWGTAIDLYFGATNNIDQGTHLVMRGMLLLVPYFNRHGWYWGGGFSGDSVDSMHFELSDETIHRVPDTPLFTAQAADAAAGAA